MYSKIKKYTKYGKLKTRLTAISQFPIKHGGHIQYNTFLKPSIIFFKFIWLLEVFFYIFIVCAINFLIDNPR